MPPVRICALGSDPGETLVSLRGPRPGLADEDDLPVEVSGELLGVLIDHVQRHVVGTADVHGLELRGASHVDDGHGVGIAEPVANGACVDVAGAGVGHRGVLVGRGRGMDGR